MAAGMLANSGTVTAIGPVLGDAEFHFLRDFVYRYCGIALSEQKRQLVQGRLLRRLRGLGLKDFGSYCELLRRDPDGELGDLASAISTNVTSFFREAHHYEFVERELLPRWLDGRRRAGDRLRLWSAGCSTGEEPYALAMVLAEALERSGSGIDARILATDLSPQALAQARQGVYALDRLGGVGEERRRRWFLRGEGDYQGLASIHPRLRELVTVMPLNLLHDWPMQGPFDAIFCRNVMIYFDKPTQGRILDRFAPLMKPDALLFAGHSENFLYVCNAFRLRGKTVYELDAKHEAGGMRRRAQG